MDGDLQMGCRVDITLICCRVHSTHCSQFITHVIVRLQCLELDKFPTRLLQACRSSAQPGSPAPRGPRRSCRSSRRGSPRVLVYLRPSMSRKGHVQVFLLRTRGWEHCILHPGRQAQAEMGGYAHWDRSLIARRLLMGSKMVRGMVESAESSQLRLAAIADMHEDFHPPSWCSLVRKDLRSFLGRACMRHCVHHL